MGQLRREITLTAATAIVVGSVIGSGIFRSPSLVAKQFPDATVILSLWVLGGVVTVFGALTVAELAAMMPQAGGPYVYIKRAFGPSWGFLTGWVYFIMGKLAIGAAVAIVFAEHASLLAETFLGWPLSAGGVLLLAAWALCTLTFVNWVGVRFGAGVNTVLTAIKALSLAAVVGLALLFDPGAAAPVDPYPAVGGLATAVLAVLFAYNSWINATIVGEEVKDPARNLPRALFFGTVLVTLLYVGVNVAYLAALGPDGMAAESLVAAAAMDSIVAFGGVFIAGSVLVSTFGNLNSGILTGARLPFSMARDGFLPRVFARVNDRDVPAAALFLELGPMLLLLFALGTFEALITAATFASFVILVAVTSALFLLRRTAPEADRPYRVHGYPFVPGVFLAASVFVVALTFAQRPGDAIVTGIVAAVGVGLLAYKRAGDRARAPEEESAPVPVEA